MNKRIARNGKIYNVETERIYNTLVSNQSKAIAANAAKDKAHGLSMAAKPS